MRLKGSSKQLYDWAYHAQSPWQRKLQPRSNGEYRGCSGDRKHSHCLFLLWTNSYRKQLPKTSSAASESTNSMRIQTSLLGGSLFEAFQRLGTASSGASETQTLLNLFPTFLALSKFRASALGTLCQVLRHYLRHHFDLTCVPIPETQLSTAENHEEDTCLQNIWRGIVSSFTCTLLTDLLTAAKIHEENACSMTTPRATPRVRSR